ncbi:MAG TPA: hypothetical protein VKP67_28910 [Xanthobacteraceae bacterium]|nr:hypothetical protein [Xanthobacteraceae bacterium]
MGSGYIIARENFKEAVKHVSAEADPVMFNLLYGLVSLTDQIEADFAAVRDALAKSPAPTQKKPQSRKAQARKAAKKTNKPRR